MKKIGLVALCMLGFLSFIGCTIPETPAATLDPALTEHMPPLIRKLGMRCDTLSQMRLHAKTERGDVFSVVCDEKTHFYKYRVLYTPSGQMSIRPWSE